MKKIIILLIIIKKWPRDIRQVILSFALKLRQQLRAGIVYQLPEYSAHKICKAACKVGDYNTFKKYYKLCDYDMFMEAGRGGNDDILDIMIRGYKADWYEIFIGACYGGHLDMAKLAVESGADQLGEGFYYACRGGRLKVAKWLITKIDYVPPEAFSTICCKGNIELFKLVLDTDILDIEVNDIQSACYGGNPEIIEYFLKNGSQSWNYGLIGACGGGHMYLIKDMISRGARNFNDGFHSACFSGQLEAVEYMISLGANYFNCKYLFEIKKVSIVKLLVSHGMATIEDCLSAAVKVNRKKIIRYFLQNPLESHHAPKYLEIILEAARKYDNKKIIKLYSN